MAHTRETADALGFRVRRDVQNRPLREIDRVGQRRMWRTVAVVLTVLTVLMGLAALRFQQIALGYRLEELKEQRAALEVERRHLLAERETLRSPKRVERIATTQLDLVPPTVDDAFVIERVTAAPAPSSAVVALR